jgi:hypothetical protein
VKWPAAASSVVVVVAVVVELHNASIAVADHHSRDRARALHDSASSVDLVAISARFGLLQQYDGLTDAEKALARDLGALGGKMADERVTTALATFQAAFAGRQTELLALKSERAALTGVERYLPVLLDDLHAQRPDDPRVERARALALSWHLAHRDERVGPMHALQDFNLALKKTPDDPLAGAEPHLRALVDRRMALDAVTTALTNAPLASVAVAVTKAVDVVVAEHEGEARRRRLAVLGLAVLVVLAMLWVPER